MLETVRKLRPTQSVIIPHICIEQRTVLIASGFRVMPSPIGWVVRKS